MNNKSYDRITERIVSLLAQGTVPWHKPWSVQTGLPRNLITQKPYRGINVFLLMAMNYESPNWLTLRQANAMGGQIKPGEKSCPVVFWKPMKVKDRESGEDRKIPFLRLYHVFNVSQCTGLKNIPPADDSAFIQTLPAELVANMPLRPVIKHGMAMASYSPVSDVVNMPDNARFASEDHYHATLFHELVHSTGHEKRLKRASITAPWRRPCGQNNSERRNASFFFQIINRPNHFERRTGLNDANAKFGQTHLRTFFGIKNIWRSHAEFPGDGNLRFARGFAELFGQGHQFFFFQKFFLSHH